MKYCGNCGQRLDDSAIFCVNCNTIIIDDEPDSAPQPPAFAAPVNPVPQNMAASQDPYPENVTHKGFWWLGFIFIGIIFYFIFKKTKPRLARSAIKGFIVAVIVWVSIIALGAFGTLMESL